MSNLQIVETTYLGIAVMDVATGEVYESGYETMAEAKRALRNFREMYS